MLKKLHDRIALQCVAISSRFFLGCKGHFPLPDGKAAREARPQGYPDKSESPGRDDESRHASDSSLLPT